MPLFLHGAVEKITGYAETEFTSGKPRWDQIIHPEDLFRVYFSREVRQLVSIPGYATEREYRIYRKDGSLRWVKEFNRNICDDANQPILIQGVIYDITEQKATEEALREAEEKQRVMLQAAGDGIILADLKGNFIDLNKSALRIYRAGKKEDLIERKVADFIPPEDHGRAEQDLQKVLAQGHVEIIQYPLLRTDGSRTEIEANVALIRDKSGSPAQIIAIIRDITERKRSEEDLRESREKMSIVFESVGEGIAVTDLQGTIIDVNEAAIRTAGYSRKEELVGRNVLELTFPEDHSQAEERAKATLEQGRSGPAEYRLVKKDGTEFDIESNTTLLRDKNGNPFGFIIIIRDISQRKRTEDTLKRIVSEWRTTFDTMSDAVLLINKKHQIIRANKAAARFLDLPFHDIIGKSCHQCVHFTSEPPEYCPHILTMADGQEHSVEVFDQQRGRHFQITTTPLVNLTGSVHVMHDITERKEAEEALKTASIETLETMSRLVEASDPYTAGHSKRVTELAVQIAQEIGLPAEQIETLRIAGFLHDLGKVGIPDTVLNKPTRLTQAEQVMIQHHPVLSAETSERVAAFKEAVPVIRHHHENWDGTGYPDGIKREEIPLLARILSVADSYDAMTSERPYRRARTNQEALAELRRCSGTQWDPGVVDTFIKIFQSESA